MNITSFSPFGYEGSMVTVEVDLRRGIPAVDLVGLADSAVKEARERMRAAIRNSNFDFPLERVLISLSPADVKKEGAGFDLAIALAVLQEKYRTPVSEFSESESKIGEQQVLVMGELELSGKVRAVRGIHAAVSTAKEKGIKICIVPKENQVEASVFSEIKVLAVDSLTEAFHSLKQIASFPDNISEKENISLRDEKITFHPIEPDMDFIHVKGQLSLVRALQIAAAGSHNLIAFGPPGCGKTLALQRFQTLLPSLTLEESLPVTRIYSLAGCHPAGQSLISVPPFRMPHQSASLEGMIGGGPNCRPGEISLAHNGVLFLDEAGEFRTSVLQTLRVPLEEGKVVLSRAGRKTTFPAQFQLLMATNPCPCGNYGVADKICVCSAHAVEQYWRKFSGPLLDRVDIRVSVSAPSELSTEESQKSISTEELRKDIEKAVGIQRKRQSKPNSQLNPSELHCYCKLNSECNEFIEEEGKKWGFSTRAIHSAIKLARTIADMEGRYNIELLDLQEAVQLRKKEGGMGTFL
jgi:magnesium chelatase family protein